MKSLKLDHDLAGQVLSGAKTSTWRIFDDKNISVNDDIILIDKVDPRDKQTWVTIGVAHVSQVVEKRLGDVHQSDFDGHEKFASQADMIEAYQKYYGETVSLQTPIKIIHFSFTASRQKEKLVDIDTTKISEVVMYADGGSRGNPGPSAAGYAIFDTHDDLLAKSGAYLGITTNNQAEYQALKLGLEEVLRMHASVVHVRMDSLLVVNQMKGVFKVKNRDLWPINDAVRQLVAKFRKVTFTHVPRELNKIADEEVNAVLDQQLATGASDSVADAA